MTAPVVLVLPYPISANRYWAHRVLPAKGNRPAMALTYVTSEAKAYKEAVAWAARAAGVRQPMQGRLVLELQLYPHRPLDFKTRMRKLGDLWDDSVQCIDLGNAEKVLSDALQGSVIENDSAFRRIVLERMEPDQHPARVVATVTPIARTVVQPGLDMELPVPEVATPAPSGPAPMVVAVAQRRKLSKAAAEAAEQRLRAADPALYADGLPF